MTVQIRFYLETICTSLLLTSSSSISVQASIIEIQAFPALYQSIAVCTSLSQKYIL